MKRILAWFLAMMMMLSALGSALAADKMPKPSMGGRTEEELYHELIVGTVAPFSGNFFSEIWGSNTADIDVRELIHGYNLVKWNMEDGGFEVNQTAVSGMVAETSAEGDKTFLISLADNLVYSDGSPITSKDYAFSLLLATSPQMTELGGMTAQMAYLKGATDYTSGQSEVLSGVKLLGDQNFSVTVDAAYLPFFYELGLLSMHPYPISEIAPGCEVADDGQGVYIRNIDEKVTKPIFTTALLEKTLTDKKKGYQSHPKVVTGAYVLTSYDEKKQTIQFDINPHFVGDSEGRKPTIETLTYKVVGKDTLLNDLLDGKIDLINKVTQADMITAGMELARNAEFGLSQYMRNGLGFIAFATEQGPTQFQGVRQALNLCLDKNQFVEEYVKNYGMRVHGYYGMGQWMANLVDASVPPAQPAGKDGQSGSSPEEWAAAWEALSLENLKPYDMDVEAAKALLEEDGWTQNQENNPFDPTKDTLRAKLVDGQLMLLELELIVPQETNCKNYFEGMVQNLQAIGGKLTLTEMPFNDLLKRYYRQEPRTNDMFFMASNFSAVFDPTRSFSTLEADQGVLNTTGIRDEQLMQLAKDMAQTQPGDILGYCQKWLAFQTYWNEVLPMIPVYSNVYFDFYTDRLHDYKIGQHSTWGDASLYAYLSDPADVEEELEEGIDPENLDGGTPVEGEGPAGGTPMGGEPVVIK